MKINKKSSISIILGIVIVAVAAAYIIKPQEQGSPSLESVPFSGTNQQNISTDRIELPAYSDRDQIVYHKAYTLNYNETHEQPSWVAYMLCRERVNGNLARNNDFRPDDAVATGSADLSDYKRSGYTRGHLVPAGDMKWDATAMSECFLLSNMSPQLSDFNEGIWNKIENRVRYWARIYDTIFIVTGPVLKDGLPTIGHNKVSVPEYFYKVVLDVKRNQGIGFVVPHHDMETTLPKIAITIDSVERLTGIDFFPTLPDDLEDRIESQCNTQNWNWK